MGVLLISVTIADCYDERHQQEGHIMSERMTYHGISMDEFHVL